MSVIDRMVDTISSLQNVSKARARETVWIVFEEIQCDLHATGECAIPKFGKFSVTERVAREGRNPQTGEKIQIAAARRVRFKPSAALKSRVALDRGPQPAARQPPRLGPPTPRSASA